VAGRGKISGPEQSILHASCVALNGQGLLILGASGRGKSGLALSLMAMGAELVADDRVVLARVGRSVIANAPDNITGLIEARGIGLLNATTCGPIPLAFVVDLNQSEAERMPPNRQTVLLGVSLGLLFKVDAPHFAAALIQVMKEGRQPEP